MRSKVLAIATLCLVVSLAFAADIKFDANDLATSRFDVTIDTSSSTRLTVNAIQRSKAPICSA